MRTNSWVAIGLALIVLVLAFGQLGTRNGVLGGIVGQDEGTYVGIRPIWNYTGTGVTVTENAANNRIDVDISAATGASTALSYVTATAEAGLSAERVLTGTADRITITDNGGVTGTIVGDIAATYAGQGTITTVGTIGTGIWQGTAVGDSYIVSGITRDAEWDTQGEVETIWGVDIVTEVATQTLTDKTLTQLQTSAATTLTLVTGAVTATQSYHAIETEGAAASDDLDTISGGTTGQVLIIKAANDARTVVAKNGTGNLKLQADFSLDNAYDRLMLLYDGTNWYEIQRSNNGS